MLTSAESIGLADRHFRQIGRLAYEIAGIQLKPGKEELVRTRLSRRIRQLELKGFDEYLRLLGSDSSGRELREMVEALTTHKTDFYREAGHFDFLREEAFPKFERCRKIRIWSAGCSTGEEPLTIAMEASEFFSRMRGIDFHILGTDLCRRTLDKARSGAFSEEQMRGLPACHVRKYFRQEQRQDQTFYRAHEDLRALVTYARLNLMAPWPMRGGFQAIFCRNVMIYFDKPTQERLVNRFFDQLCPGGYLFTGHSESLMGARHPFQFIQPAVYLKKVE